MIPLFTPFDPQPSRDDGPARLPSPFHEGPPHPLAARACAIVQAQLRHGIPAPPSSFEGLHLGKMFGVLVVAAPDGPIGFLRGFSGMLDGSWQVPGFVGPLFDPARRDAVWPAGQIELASYDQRLAALETGSEATAARAALANLDEVHASTMASMAADQASRRQQRHHQRDQAEATLRPEDLSATLATLAHQSSVDGRDLRRLRGVHRREREAAVATLQGLDDRRRALQRERATRSCQLLEQLFDGYQIPSANGTVRSLRSLFAPHTPPGGSGDCAAPKLFAHALAHRLRPLALAEFWWGTPPSAGGRQPGVYYPSCRGKCGPILAHMLDGWDVDPAPVFGADGVADDQPRVVFEDRWLLVVDKPVGLLSVPGRSGLLQDSVLTRLRRRLPADQSPIVAHRLDLDTSGLLLLAKDAETYVLLQRQFLERSIDKTYVAWLDGHVRGEAGTVDLALRVDVDDRPRQIHDPVHGKPATTDWRVDVRSGGRTRVILHPRTGRTHQLRVHTSHPAGLDAAICGDRLYGRPSGRLMLHAEALSLVHPHTGQPVLLRAPAPF